MPKSTINKYEATFILGEEASETTAKQKVASLTELIQKFGGTVSNTEMWGKRELAYPIKRNKVGFYTTMWMELPATEVANFEKQLRFDESIIRFLVTLAYTSAQAGSLYPVVEEEEKPARPKRGATVETTEPASAEAELRRTSSKPVKKAAKKEVVEVEEQSEEERMEKLDAALGDILKDEA